MKILHVVDTREYEEIADGKWAAIPGSGDARECDRCGRLHEVHAYVETDDGATMVVGTGCMGLGPEVARKFASKAGTIAKLTAEREHVADLITAREAARREVAKLTPPEPTRWTKPWGEGVSVGGHDVLYQPAAGGTWKKAISEATQDALDSWRRAMVDKLAGTRTPDYTLRDRLKQIDKRLWAAEKASAVSHESNADSVTVESTPDSIEMYVGGARVGGVMIFDSLRSLNARLRNTPHSPFNAEVEGKVGWLPVVELSPSMRGQGVGTRLVRMMLAEARGRGLTAVFLHAGEPMGHSNWRQVQFWSRFGFQTLRYDDGTYFSQPMMLVL